MGGVAADRCAGFAAPIVGWQRTGSDSLAGYLGMDQPVPSHKPAGLDGHGSEVWPVRVAAAGICGQATGHQPLGQLVRPVPAGNADAGCRAGT